MSNQEMKIRTFIIHVQDPVLMTQKNRSADSNSIKDDTEN